MTKSLGSIAAGSLFLAAIFFVVAMMLSHDHDLRFGSAQNGTSKPGSAQWAWDGGERLQIDVPADVTVIPGGTPTLTVHGDQELVQRLSFRHGRLSSDGGDDACFIPFFCGHDHGNHSVKVELHGVTLKEVRVSGVAQVDMGHLDQDRLSLRLSGAGKVEGQGRLDELDVTISGAGEASFGELAVARARVTLSGVGEAEIAPTEEADITISGIGNVRLNSRPARLIQHISGLGNITGPGSGGRDDDEDSQKPVAAPQPPVPPQRHSDNDLRREIRDQVREQVKEARDEVKQQVDEALREKGLK